MCRMRIAARLIVPALAVLAVNGMLWAAVKPKSGKPSPPPKSQTQPKTQAPAKAVGTATKAQPVAQTPSGGMADFKPGAEPDGFRGKTWAAPFSDFSNLEKEGTSHIGGHEITEYRIPDDSLSYGGVTSQEVGYFFTEDKFYGMGIHFADLQAGDWGKLSKALLDQYGDVVELELKGRPAYFWSGNNTIVRLESWTDESAELYIWSRYLSPISTTALDRFQDAVSYGNVEAVRKMIADDPSLAKAADDQGKTPLMWAILCHPMKSPEAVIEVLLSKGADIQAKDRDGSTALYTAAASGFEGITKLLVAKGADVNARCYHNKTPLLTCAGRTDTSIAEYLVAQGADVNLKDDDGNTPLQEAAMWGSTDLVKLLLSKGADVNAADHDGWTPLHAACSLTGSAETAKALIAAGAKVSIRESKHGAMPIHTAAFNFRDDCVKALLAAGADVNARDNENATPLNYVRGGLEDVAAFSDDAADQNVDQQMQTNHTAQLLRDHGGVE